MAVVKFHWPRNMVDIPLAKRFTGDGAAPGLEYTSGRRMPRQGLLDRIQVVPLRSFHKNRFAASLASDTPRTT